MTRIPARADHSRKRRSGIERPRLVRLTSPATPSAARRPVSRVGSTPVPIWNAIGRQYCPFTTRKLTQFSVPRKMLSKLVEDEVTCADSVYGTRSEEHTSELQSHVNLVCRLLLEKKRRD